MARSIVDPSGRVEALARVAEVLTRAGQHKRAATVLSKAEATARALPDNDPNLWRAWASARLAEALIRDRPQSRPGPAKPKPPPAP